MQFGLCGYVTKQKELSYPKELEAIDALMKGNLGYAELLIDRMAEEHPTITGEASTWCFNVKAHALSHKYTQQFLDYTARWLAGKVPQDPFDPAWKSVRDAEGLASDCGLLAVKSAQPLPKAHPEAVRRRTFKAQEYIELSE
jgi:hypothetical protein